MMDLHSTPSITKSPLTKYRLYQGKPLHLIFPFTYKYVAFNEKQPITKENLRIIFFGIDAVECTS